MGIYVSPGVYTKEVDLSNIIQSLSTTTAAIVGASNKGDTTQIRLITNTQQFVEEYGEPVLGNYFHYSALAFLENGNKLWCYRVQNSALYSGVDIKTSDSVQSNAAIDSGVTSPDYVSTSGQDDLFQIYSKDPGLWGNDLGIRISGVDETTYEFKITVYLKDENSIYQELETWTVSRKHQLDGYGSQQYLETAINGFSDYIVVADSPTATYADTVLPKVQATTLVFTEGSNGSTVADSHYITGWGLFENPDDVDIRIMIGGGQTSVNVQTELKRIAEARKDCIAILDVPLAETTSAASTVAWREVTQNFNSSYCALYSPWVKVYDSYNSTIVTLPPSGYVASQIAYNDYVTEVWYAPAGLNRGLLNVLSVVPVYTQGERDTLYETGINPLQTFRGEGNVVWGQKTEQTKASALDRINVRRLLITLEKAMAVSLRSFTFEPNSEITRFRIVAMLESYLDILSAKGAFQSELGDKGYSVVCDTTNNTPATIDRNELHVDVFIKPSRAAEFIELSVIVTATGATFSELIARGVNL